MVLFSQPDRAPPSASGIGKPKYQKYLLQDRVIIRL